MNKIVKKKRMIMITTLVVVIITICVFYKMLFGKTSLNGDFKIKLYDLRKEISAGDKYDIIASLESVYIEDDEYACFNRNKVEYDREINTEAYVVREARRLSDEYTLDAYRRYHQTFNLTNTGVNFLLCRIIGAKYAGMTDNKSDEELISFFLDESKKNNYELHYVYIREMIDTFGYDLVASKYNMQDYYEDIIRGCNFDSEMRLNKDGSLKEFDVSTAVELRVLKKMHLSDRLDMVKVNAWLERNKSIIESFISNQAPGDYDHSFIIFAWAYYEYTGDISLLETEDERYHAYLMSEDYQGDKATLVDVFGVRNSELFLHEHQDFIEKEIESMHSYVDLYDYSIESMHGDAYYDLYMALVLADACDFKYDKEKIKALVKKKISDSSDWDSVAAVYDAVRLAYILGIIDEIPDGFTKEIDSRLDEIEPDKSPYQIISICYQVKLLMNPDYKIPSGTKKTLVSRMKDIKSVAADDIEYYIALSFILDIKPDSDTKAKLLKSVEENESNIGKLYYKYVINRMN